MSLNAVCFVCEDVLPLSAEAIAAEILDVTNWSAFPGCWPIPGIRSAEFAVRTPEVVGSRIAVVNRDGSRHVEEITKWDPPRGLQMVMQDFSPPLSRMAERFVETWGFESLSDGPPPQTRVTRSFELYARSRAARFMLRPISLLLKRAVRRHLAMMKADAEQAAG